MKDMDMKQMLVSRQLQDELSFSNEFRRREITTLSRNVHNIRHAKGTYRGLRETF